MSRPDPAILRELLSCDPATGRLWWRERDRKWFETDGAWKSWNTRYAGTEAFTAVRHNGYKVGNIFNSNIRAHHAVWCLCYSEWPVEIDHIDGNRQNNALSNLRAVTRQENNRNLTRSRSNTSGVTGVFWDKRRRQWRAEICIDYKNTRIGVFANFDDAVRARKTAEQHYGFHSNHGRAPIC